MMADLKSVVNPILLAEEDLRRGIELLFFAYRDFTGEADRQLAELGLGRAIIAPSISSDATRA